MVQNTSYAAEARGSLLVLVLLALIVGAAAGLVGAIFRLTLEQADRLRDALIAWAQGEKLAGFLFVVATCAAAALIAAWLVRRFSPHASGSGIPHVEAVLNEEIPQAPFHLIWVKFCGGVLAIGSGLALGREGPSVQMGASVAHLVGKVFRREWPDCRVLLAAGAGAGLATAFNAPMAGAVFVLEELVRRFELRIAVAALGASATAIAVARVFLGDAPDFHVDALAYASAEATPLFFVLGAVAGLAAIAYNRALLETITAAERLDRLSVELRAGLIGAAVGTLAWFAPSVVGAATRSPSERSSGRRRFRCFHCFFYSASGSARYHTPPEHRAGCSHPCSCSARSSACCSDFCAGWYSLAWTFRQKVLPSSEWPPSSPAWCAPH
jgi:CIC family chloride channel protein